MRTLETLDYTIIGLYLLLVFAAGLVLTRRASQSLEHFFVGGRSLPWWLVGVSMAATNFSIDTPISITGFVAKEGIGGVWFFWASAISAMLVTFLFARLWRRAGVLTDAEIIEVRYSGRSAAGLRLFKGVYFGVIFNAFIMGWVFLALAKVVGGVTDLDTDQVLWGTTVLVFVYTVASGFYGVVVTDFLQYFFALAGTLLLAYYAVAEVGGLSTLVTEIETTAALGPGTLDFFPSFGAESDLPISVFFTYLGVQWWAHKYADGGGKHIQRMLSAKNEDHAVGASLLFSFMNYALQIWPWILTALCALVLFGRMEDPEMGYAMTMAKVLPVGVLGFVVACLMGAFMSTIDTHLNLGASYIVNDIYKRFLKPDADERHYVMVSRVSMAGLLALAVVLSQNIGSVGGAWKFLLTFASGAGLTWIVRWFWWRANAWTELSGMLTSGVVATWIQLAAPDWLYSSKLLVTVGVSTVVWLTVTLLTPPVDEETLVSFVKRIRPGSPGWRKICQRHGITQQPFLRPAVDAWVLGLVALFAVNFGVGNLLLGAPKLGAGLLVVGCAALWWVLKRVRGQRE
jgi:SSS family solute:Na+ symporter